MLRIFLILALIAGCATKPTRYKRYSKKEGGYIQEKFDENLNIVRFEANSETKKGRAELFAKFRAIEICVFDSGKKFAHIIGVEDKSKKKEITRTSSNVYGFPSYYYGYPYWQRYSGINFSLGYNNIQSNSWNETYVYPEFDVLYECSDTAIEAEVIFRDVPSEELKHLVKDLKGAVQVEKILDGSPNKNALEYGDIILKGNGVRIQKSYQLIMLLGPKHTEAKLDILREGEKKTVTIKGKDVSESLAKSQLEIIQAACKVSEIKGREICKRKI